MNIFTQKAKLLKEIKSQQEKIQELKSENKSLKDDVSDLKDSNTEMNKEIKEDFEYQKPDIYISIHVGPKLYSRPGHLDICFEDEVIAFGQYDKDSLSFFKIFGDGVMYSLNDRLKYYDFVIETDKKIVFEYGFKFSNSSNVTSSSPLNL